MAPEGWRVERRGPSLLCWCVRARNFDRFNRFFPLPPLLSSNIQGKNRVTLPEILLLSLSLSPTD